MVDVDLLYLMRVKLYAVRYEIWNIVNLIIHI